ncbi:MAG: LysR substrate-binding domain-containing protein [Gammaproteobacteria bacterium]
MNRLNAMECFLSVVEHGSFSNAGRSLGLSKATISKRVAELERHLNVQLLLRTSRHVTPTEIGQDYFERCRRLLHDLKEIEGAVHKSQTELSGVLRIAAPLTFSDIYLAPAIQQFRENNSGVEFELTLTDNFVDLFQYPYDLAIRISQLEDSSLIARPLARSSVICCASPSYLSSHGKPNQPDELDQHELIVDTNFRNPNEWQFLVGGKQISYHAKASVKVNSAYFARNLAMAGGGVTLSPEFVVRDALENGQLQQLDLQCNYEDLGIYAIYSSRHHQSQRLREFINFLDNWFKE